jgi:TonB family protein
MERKIRIQVKVSKISRHIMLQMSFVLLLSDTGTQARHFCGLIEDPKSQSSRAADPEQIYESKDVDQKVKILKKPEPGYTRESQEREIDGTVVLKAVFSSIGKVTNITVVKELPAGLTQKAIEAARKIKFKPALKDGRPVSVYMQVEYYFRQY